MKFTINKKNNIYILITFIICVLYVYYDINENQKQINAIIETESKLLANVIRTGFENTISASSALEDEMIDKLVYNSKIIADKLSTKKISTKKLQKIADELDLELICILNKNDTVLMSNFNEDFEFTSHTISIIENMKKNHYEWIEIGEIDNPIDNNVLYLIAKNDNNRVIILGINTTRLTEYRRNFGIGRQIFDIVQNSDIKYLILQDREGLIAASGDYQSAEFVDVDSILNNINIKKLASINEYKQDSVIYEIIKPIRINQASSAIIRLGISLSKYEQIKLISNYRAIGIALAFFITNFIIIILLSTRKAYSGLEKEKNIISSYNTLILENMADAVIAVDETDKIILVNNALGEIFEIPKSFILNKNLNNIIDIDDKLLNNQVKELTVKIKGKNKILSFMISEIEIEDKSNVRIILLRDLTSEREIQSALQRKEKISAMGELAASVAHEIRNPLNSINVIAQRFELEFEPETDKKEYFKLVKVIREEAQRVNRIIKQFLEYARPAKLNLTSTNLEQLIKDCYSLMASEMEKVNIKFDFNTNFSNSLFINIDSDKLKQVFINLFRNSIDAIVKDGLIKCTIVLLADRVEIIFSDTGGGIANEIIDKIFNLYFTTKHTGTGLGLSIVHQIISEHNGILLVSNNENGAEFIIKLKI